MRLAAAIKMHHDPIVLGDEWGTLWSNFPILLLADHFTRK